MGFGAELQNDFGDDFAHGGGERVYLNNASVSLMPALSIAAMADFVTEYNAAGPDSEQADELVAESMQNVRRMVSEIISCRPDEIALTQSTTDGINMVASGLGTLAAGSNVVIRGMEHEHHANLYPWLRLGERGVQIRSLPIDAHGFFDMAHLESFVDERTALVTLSHALYNTGAILPVGEVGRIMHRRDGGFFVDAAQTIGCMDAASCDVSALRCDYMSFNGSKWLCGPMGTGLFYCSSDAGRDLEPALIGGESAVLHSDGGQGGGDDKGGDGEGGADDAAPIPSRPLEFKNAPDKFQTGFRNYAGVAGLEASLRYLKEVGLEKIRARNKNLSGLLQDGLGGMQGCIKTYIPDDPGARSSIMSFNVRDKNPRDVVRRLEGRGLVLAVRELGGTEVIRASPHFFNTENQIHLLVDEIRALL